MASAQRPGEPPTIPARPVHIVLAGRQTGPEIHAKKPARIPVKRELRAICATALLLVSTTPAADEVYPDGHGGEVSFPMGASSFADQVVSYGGGDPSPAERAADPQAALGPPDLADKDAGAYVTLGCGCGGELVLAFADNALVDVPGPDLYVFEIGPDTKATALAVSGDGNDWTRVGRIAGGKAEVDLAPYVDSESDFRYVRLVDLKSACGSGEEDWRGIWARGQRLL